MRALHSSSPVGLERLGFRTRNKSGLARGKTEDPERSFFLTGVARGVCGTAETPDAEFPGVGARSVSV